MKLFLSGDIMIGRGIDQVLPHPSDPVLHEDYMKDARDYLHIAETANGPIPRPVDFSYIWGDALDTIEKQAPDARIINLETSVTTSDDYWKGKGINYRMNPRNIPCLIAAKIDMCSLANNHVLDWGYEGLLETLKTLKTAGIKTAGAGKNLDEAEALEVMAVLNKGRVVIFAFGHESAGITPVWRASKVKPGINVLPDFSKRTIQAIEKKVHEAKQRGDIVVASLHWGPNWGYDVSREHTSFAHGLIDEAGVDIVHGHSSHHPKAIEVYRGKLILYGCGDLINDYEGIEGYEDFRSELGNLYFLSVDPLSGRLLGLRMVVMTMRRFRLGKSTSEDVLWMKRVLSREGRAVGTEVSLEEGDTLVLNWA